jgi:hypothetical protein
MRVLVCGDRNWSNWELLYEVLEWFPITFLVTGGAKGADTIAEAYAFGRGFSYRVHHADWNAYGRAAGPIRNTRMLEEDPDLVIAFHDDLSKSKGTKNMVKQAQKAGVVVITVNDAGEWDVL